jgi:hypothetical protein
MSLSLPRNPSGPVFPLAEGPPRVMLAAVAAGMVGLIITEELEAEYRRAVEYPQVRLESIPFR